MHLSYWIIRIVQVVGFNYNVDIHIVGVQVEVWCGVVLSYPMVGTMENYVWRKRGEIRLLLFAFLVIECNKWLLMIVQLSQNT